MPRCEDFPCCGHQAGDCPSHDAEGFEVWRCVECGRQLPRRATSSICPKCMRHLQRSWSDGGDHDHSMDY